MARGLWCVTKLLIVLRAMLATQISLVTAEMIGGG
jgi:hypothetical protein